MLRVGIDLTPLIGPPTGIHQHTRHLADALLERDDIEISGWLLSARGTKPAFEAPIHRSPVPAALAARLWSRVAWPGRRIVAGGVDVVHGTNFLGPPAPSTVLTVHDLTPIRHPELVEPAVAAKAPAILAAIDHGAWVHTPSQAIADELAALTTTDRIRVVHQGLGPVHAQPGASRHAVRFERFVLVLGTTERRKRVPMVVEAMAQLPTDIGLVIAGPAGNDEAAVARAISGSGLESRVTRLTDVDDTLRDALIVDATVLALAASYEGFGFTPLEAAAAGTAVVATAVGALPELIGDQLALADPQAPDLGPLLASACEDPSMPAVVTDRLRALTWRAHAAAMVELYRSAAS